MKQNFSKIIQGCMTWGVWGRDLNTSEMSNRISQNVDLGVTTFDHADIYGNYTTEKAFGKALLQSEIKREDIQLISKCGIQLINDKRQTYVKHYNYDASYIITQAEQSLKNLKTDYLDLFLLHRPSPLMQIDEVTKAIQKLQKEGKIKQFGVSNFTPAQIDYLAKEISISVNQIQCSLTHYEPFEGDSLFYHQKNNILTMAWSPLGESLNLEKSSSLRIKLEQFSEQYHCKISQLVLAWLLKHPTNIYPVIGTTKTERVKEASESQNINLDLQDWFKLYETVRGQEVA